MKEKCRYTDMRIYGTITVVFIVLKVLGVVEWEWFVVFSPILIGFALKLAFLLLTLLVILYKWRIRK